MILNGIPCPSLRPPPARVAVAQSSSLSLFTNRDAELEQRAMLLKRLAFTIYSSEVDQYQKYLPDIQGNGELYKATTDCVSCSLVYCFKNHTHSLRAPGGEPASSSGAHPPCSGVPLLQGAVAAHVASAPHLIMAHYDHRTGELSMLSRKIGFLDDIVVYCPFSNLDICLFLGAGVSVDGTRTDSR